jgi:ketosteroid isomerase-like protein
MVSRNILVASVIVVILVAGAGFYFIQQPSVTVSPPKPTTPSTPATSPTPKPPPLIQPEEEVKKVVQAYFDAINAHSWDKLASLFTKDVTISISYWGQAPMGITDVKSYYEEMYTLDPTFGMKLLNITEVTVSTNNAQAKGTYLITGKRNDIAFEGNYDQLSMIKQGNEWKVLRVSVAHYSPDVVCPKLTQPVTLDGKWTTPEEWSDAVVVPMEYSPTAALEFPNNGTAYLLVKHDTHYLYIMVDYISDTTPGSAAMPNTWWEGAYVYFDPMKNRGSEPQQDDYVYELAVSGGQEWHARVPVKNNAYDWKASIEMPSASAFSSDVTNDPHSKNKHVIYEFKIPLPKETEVGFFAAAIDTGSKSYMTWPGKVRDWTLDGWSTLKLSEQTK